MTDQGTVTALDARLTCSTVCFRDRDLPDALATIEQLGFTSADLSALAGLCEHIPPHAEQDKLDEASRALRASSLTFTSINADTGSFNGIENPDVIFTRIDRLAAFAADHDIPMLVLTCGETEQAAVSVDQQVQTVAAGLNHAATITARYGIELAVEAPHYFRLVNTPARVNRLIELLDPAVSVVFDTSHVRAAGEITELAYPRHANRVHHIHFRDAIDGDIRRVIGAGDIDFDAVVSTAIHSGYTGRYVLELETHDSPFDTKDDEVADAIRRLTPVFASHVTGASA